MRLRLAEDVEWLVCYDIADDAVRDEVAKRLGGVGHRLQYSVFSVWCSESELGALRGQLRSLINLRTDSVRYYAACRRWPRPDAAPVADPAMRSCTDAARAGFLLDGYWIT